MPVTDSDDKTALKVQDNTAGVSRRQLFRTAALFTGGAALVAGGVASSPATADAAKLSKEAAAYQDKPQGEQSCANCSLFIAPAGCGVVEGNISASAWCKLYQKNS